MTKTTPGWASATLLSATLLLATMPLPVLAQPNGGEPITRSQGADNQRVIEARLGGDQTAEYRVAAQQGQTLSVDLDASRDSVFFNIKSADGGEFLFAGMMAGNVADVALPESGDYLVQVFLVRAAARRDEQASYTLTISVGEPRDAETSDVPTSDVPTSEAPANDSPAGDAPTVDADRDSAEPAKAERPDERDGPKYWQVELEDATSGLNVRSGPGQQYAIAGQLTSGETLENLGCRLSGADRWCHVRAAGSGLRGWVAGRFLIEGTPPSPFSPSKKDGEQSGPETESNGRDFDATGTVDCVLEPGQPAQSCPFGIVRDGPGNAGLWIATPSSQESRDTLHILFETGMVTAVSRNDSQDVSKDTKRSGLTNGADYVARKIDDHYEIDTGMRQFVIPEAVVYGQKAETNDDEAVDDGVVDGDRIDGDPVDGDAIDDSVGDDHAVNAPQGSD